MSDDEKAARATAEARVGQLLNDKWRIDRVLDLGGMAAVFAATHRNGKRVAIKMLHPHIAANESIRLRFLREGYVANRVEHRGAVQVLDDDKTVDGAVFLVMELLEGDSLERLLRGKPGHRLPAHEVLGMADQVLDTLGAFHAEGVIHRDIKPANLFITREGVVKVLDFGLARLREPEAGKVAHTGVGVVLGTVAYMPPEQALGKSNEIDARTDLFAVGAVMFQAISGGIFVVGATPLERLRCASRTPAPKLSTFVPGIPGYLAAVVDTALAFDKAKRWADARAMRAAVQSAYHVLMGEARKRTGPPPLPPTHATKPAADATGGETIYREALESSIVVDVSFGDDCSDPRPVE